MRKNYGFSQNIAVFSFIILSLGLSLFVTLEGIAFAQFAGNDLFGEINKMLQTVNHALSTNPPSVDVTGTYSCNDGATYYVRQVPPGLVFGWASAQTTVDHSQMSVPVQFKVRPLPETGPTCH